MENDPFVADGPAFLAVPRELNGVQGGVLAITHLGRPRCLRGQHRDGDQQCLHGACSL